MDSRDPNILTKLAKVVVIVTKGGSNLLSASKLLFRLSKVSTLHVFGNTHKPNSLLQAPDNDQIFRANGIFDTILQTLGSSGTWQVQGIQMILTVFLQGRLNQLSVIFLV